MLYIAKTKQNMYIIHVCIHNIMHSAWHDHGINTCTKSVTCVNCSETTDSHFKKCHKVLWESFIFPISQDCPIWKQQMENNMFTRNISFVNAKTLVEITITNESYAFYVRTSSETTPKVTTWSKKLPNCLIMGKNDTPQIFAPEQSAHCLRYRCCLNLGQLVKSRFIFISGSIISVHATTSIWNKFVRKTQIKPRTASKGSDNQIQLFDKFGSLGDMDVSENIYHGTHRVSQSKCRVDPKSLHRKDSFVQKYCTLN